MAKHALMDGIVADDDIKYLTQNAPAKNDGLDYAAWTESVFAR